MHLKSPILILILFFLHGCATTMSGADCQSADWSKVGFEDGARGLQLNYLDSHNKTCEKHGVSPDAQAYAVGHHAGLKVYCQPHVGYQLGVDGKEYYFFCPAEVESQFVQEYVNGLNIKIEQLENEQRRLVAYLQNLRQNLANEHIPERRAKINSTLDYYQSLEKNNFEQFNNLHDWKYRAT